MLRNWQWLFLAPLTLSVLTACPEHTHRTDAPPSAGQRPPSPGGGGGSQNGGGDISRFVGFWINGKALDDYRALGAYPDRFCQAVFNNNDDRHGVDFAHNPKWKNRVHPRALRVYPNGEIYDWLPTMRDDSPRTRGAMGGTVDYDGYVAVGMDRTTMMAAGRATLGDADDTPQIRMWIVNERSGPTLTTFNQRTGEQRALHRTNEDELLNYSYLVANCLNGDGQNAPPRNVPPQNGPATTTAGSRSSQRLPPRTVRPSTRQRQQQQQQDYGDNGEDDDQH